MTTTECPPERLAQVIEAINADDEQGLGALDAALVEFADDARLHFLRGSVLAALRRYDEGRLAMQRAVAMAPGFAIARFQLGFLEFTSGDVQLALSSWRPLEDLGEDDPLRLFARGLAHMARDEFAEAVALLRRGISANRAFPPLNNDMQLLITRMEEATGAEPLSAAQILLQQHASRTRH